MGFKTMEQVLEAENKQMREVSTDLATDLICVLTRILILGEDIDTKLQITLDEAPHFRQAYAKVQGLYPNVKVPVMPRNLA